MAYGSAAVWRCSAFIACTFFDVCSRTIRAPGGESNLD